MIKLLIIPSLLLGGCAKRSEMKGSFLSVTKPPIQIIYLTKEITPQMVHGLVKQVEAHPYHDYKFNDTVSVQLEGSSHESSHTSNSTALTTSRTKE